MIDPIQLPCDKTLFICAMRIVHLIYMAGYPIEIHSHILVQEF